LRCARAAREPRRIRGADPRGARPPVRAGARVVAAVARAVRQPRGAAVRRARVHLSVPRGARGDAGADAGDRQGNAVKRSLGMDESGHGYDDVAIGDTFSRSITITDTHLVLGAGLIGDFNPHHVNAEYEKGPPIGHPTL